MSTDGTKSTIPWKTAFVFLTILLCCAVVEASIYYVSTEGDDAADGRSETTAWRTVAHAATTAKAGDTVRIRAGTYEGEHVVLLGSGTKDEPIVFEGYAGTPVLDGGEAVPRLGMLVRNSEHIALTNLMLRRYMCGLRVVASRHISVDRITCHDMGRGNSGVGFSVSLSRHCTFTRCETRNCAMHGLNIMSRSYNILVDDCTFYVTPKEKLCSDYGIYTEHAHHNTIRNCTIRNVNPTFTGRAYGGGHGVALRISSHHNTVIGCRSFAVLEHFVAADDSHHNEFVDCEAYNAGDVRHSHTDGLVARMGAHDNRFVNCRVLGCTTGIHLWHAKPGMVEIKWTVDNLARRNVFRNCVVVTKPRKNWHCCIGLARAQENLIENCTFVVRGNINNALFYLGDDNTTSGNALKNCIVSGAREMRSGKGVTPAVTCSCFWRSSFDMPPGAGNLSADPLFADPTDGDYHLRSRAGRWDPKANAWVADHISSPCIDAGAPEAEFKKEPAPNGGRVNIGAYWNTAEASKSSDFSVRASWPEDPSSRRRRSQGLALSDGVRVVGTQGR